MQGPGGRENRNDNSTDILTRSTTLSPVFEGGEGNLRSALTLGLRPELGPKARPGIHAKEPKS
jgi:hypothetical protein